MTRRYRRFRVARSKHLPRGAINTHHVFDGQIGMVVRKSDGSLAYFPTRTEAEIYAATLNDLDVAIRARTDTS